MATPPDSDSRADRSSSEPEDRALEALSRRTLDQMLEGCQIIGRDFRYLYVNDPLARHGRKPKHELLGRTMMEAYPGIEKTPVFEAIVRAMEHRIGAHLENEFEFADGTRGAFELRVQPVPEGVFILSIDISERVQAQRLLNRAQRLKSLGTLASGVAHDLNNALAPILLAATALRHDSGDREMLRLIEDSTQRARKLVQQLLMFAKGSNGERAAVHVPALLSDLRRLIQSTFPSAIETRFQCADSLPTVMGDATQLHQVLLNLCINARDAMPNGGTLTLEANVMDVDETYARAALHGRPGRFVTVTVCDTGCGIAPEVQDRIFEPFFTTKELETSTGLGLSTSLGIVHSHGGFLSMQSEHGNGTTFRLFLPAAETDARDLRQAPAARDVTDAPRR